MRVGLPGLLTLLFIAARLFGIIDWAWWWLVSPLWGAVVLFVVLTMLGAVLELWEQDKKHRGGMWR